AQDRDPGLEAEAGRVAARFGLPLTVVDTGTSRLERELEALITGDGMWPLAPAYFSYDLAPQTMTNQTAERPFRVISPGTAAGPRPCRRGRAVCGGGVFGGARANAAPLLESPRCEVSPAGGVAAKVAQWVPPGLTVTVTASPTKGLDATLDLTEVLAGRGYQ